VGEEPEQVLPEQRVAAARPLDDLAAHHQAGGHEEARAGNAVHELQDAAASSGGKASSSRNEVTNCAQTKNGSRKKVSPGARAGSW
jgi:hypothetical protein